MNEDRVLSTAHGQFLLQSWSGRNDSGIDPVCDKVVVLVDPAMDRTKGGIIVTETSSERMTLASTTGILVAVGPMAFRFNSDRTHRWEGAAPAVGTRVCFQRYSGQEYTGLDGNLYRVIQDTCIAGTQGAADLVEHDEAPAMADIMTGRASGIVFGKATA